MEVEDAILEFFPDITLPKRIELQSQLAPYTSLLDRHNYIRKMTIVEILHRVYDGSIQDELKKMKSGQEDGT